MIYSLILAGGKGKRAGGDVPKQYADINGYPLLYYTIRAFEQSDVDRISIVADREHIQYVVSDIVDRYNFNKVIRVCEGGEERFNSVHHGLDDLKDEASIDDIVLIHDGARPFITSGEIGDIVAGVDKYGAAIAAMPVKDTIKIADEHGFVKDTTDRALTWQVQTPQGFKYGLIRDAYKRSFALTRSGDENDGPGVLKPEQFTDDAMVLANIYKDKKVKLVKTSYGNIKITTPADLELAKQHLK